MGIALKISYITKEASANFKNLVTYIIVLLQLNKNTTIKPHLKKLAL